LERGIIRFYRIDTGIFFNNKGWWKCEKGRGERGLEGRRGKLGFVEGRNEQDVGERLDVFILLIFVLRILVVLAA
jgi:hypothetical protein